MKFLLVALGGALGALSRFVVSEIMETSENNIFPFPTLLVNMAGCFAIGYLYNSMGPKYWLFSEPFLIVGFLGAFTTFSAFSKETLVLVNEGVITMAIFYVLISVLGCLLATWLGIVLSAR